ncbi:MAG TPA: hypothetical protein VM871_10320, partial [Flavisolibacter sp.]|nr:hypothetical protein [Flavisolibacter sp.]
MEFPPKSRREFVKQSSVLAGGLFISNLAGANFFSGSDDVIKIAVVGCGGRGTGAALQALTTKQKVKLVAMADAFQDRLDDCYKTLTADDTADSSGTPGSVKHKIDVPEERRFTGFDGYQKAMA